MRRPSAVTFLVLGVLAVPSGAATAAALEGSMASSEAVGVGGLAADGSAWALRFVMEPDLPPPAAALFHLAADRVVVRQEWHDYVGTPAGLVGRDASLQTARDDLVGADLGLAQARAEAQFLAVAAGAALPQAHAGMSSARLHAAARPRLDFFPSLALTPANDLQRSVEAGASTLALQADALAEAAVVRGDFTVYVWDLDLRSGDRTFASGTIRSNGIAPNALAPDGVVYDARQELLTLEVHGGVLRANLPQRPVELFFGEDGARATSTGSWDLSGASGRLGLDARRHEVAGQDVHLEGRFDARFAPSPDGALRSTWSGSVDAAAIDRSLLPLGGPIATDQHALWWPVLGIAGVVAAGGGTAYAWRRTRLPLRRATDDAPPADDADLATAQTDALVVRCIALVQEGRLDEVVGELEPRFDPGDPAAPVKAYLLSLAHLRAGRREDGIRWIRRAVELYPEFATELAVNDDFRAVRADPRLRAFQAADNEGVTGYA